MLKETCLFCGRVIPSKPTNADRIRSMSDEELAAALMCQNEMGMDDIPCDHSDDKNCCQCLLEWLRQPAEGGHQCMSRPNGGN